MMTVDLRNSTFLWNLVFGLTLLVYAAGLFIPIMEPDAAVYAQVSMEMHDRGDYLSIYHKGADWLDKPHFPFWMSALSYNIFGVNTFAYKLPAVIFVLLAAFYTYLFGKKFYTPLVGWIAVIILITAEHVIISNQDVRAEPFMMGLMIMGLYHLASLVQRGGRTKRSDDRAVIASEGTHLPVIPSERSDARNLTMLHQSENDKPFTSPSDARNLHSQNTAIHITLGSLACACLIMTKGLFTIIPIASGIGLALLYRKQWKQIFHLRWLLVVILTALFLTPAIYGYYQQFDKHPEKVIFGQTSVSGVEFFLWTSQWGRFTNTGPIKGKGDISFFVHTMLWAFLPWAFAAFFALFRKTKQLISRITTGEDFTFFGFITLFLIFSASRFQLSFYLNPIFPLISILTAAILLQSSRKTWRTFSIIHLVLSLLLVLGLVGLHYVFSAHVPHIDTIVVVLIGLLIAFYLFTRSNSFIKKTIFAASLVVLSVNYYLNREFYPQLLKYQAESEAAYYMKQNNIPANEVVFADEMESVADVIMHHPTTVIAVDSINTNLVADRYLFTNESGRAKVDSLGLENSLVRTFDDFPVTRLTGKFINKKTRQLEVKKKYLIKVGSQANGR